MERGGSVGSVTESEAVTLESLHAEIQELRETMAPLVEFIQMLEAAIKNHPMASMLLKQ
jgi:hypothetical protein